MNETDELKDEFGLIKITYYTTAFCSMINLSCIFLILSKAPREMRNQAKYIAYANLGAVLLDLDYGLFCPSRLAMINRIEFTMRFVGLLSIWDIEPRIQTVLHLFSAWHMSFALHCLFLGALRRILPIGSRKRTIASFIGLISLLNGLLLLSYFTAFFIFYNKTKYIVYPATHRILFKTKTPHTLSSVFCLVTATCCQTGLILVSAWHFFSTKNTVSLSKATIQKQKMFLKNSFVQLLIPILLFAAPVYMRKVSMANKWSKTEFITEISKFLQTFYGSIFTITTIIIYRPYREFLFKRFRCRRRTQQMVPMSTQENQETNDELKVLSLQS